MPNKRDMVKERERFIIWPRTHRRKRQSKHSAHLQPSSGYTNTGIRLRTGSGALVAHTYNPSYLGGRVQEDQVSKPAQANSSRDPISKNPITKKGWWSGSKYRP
jgi:hypothetical protein